MKKQTVIIILVVVLIAAFYLFFPTKEAQEQIPIINSNIIDRSFDEPDLKPETKCLPEQRDADFCIEIYQPVCAKVNVQCIKAPCPPIEQTFSNSCKACQNSLVESYIKGECKN